MLFIRPRLILSCLLCLLGTLLVPAAAHAETMVYRVYLGPMYAGKISFNSTLTDTAYSIEAHLLDNLPLVTFDDVMHVEGTIAKGVWVPALYEQKLHENDYVAHKQIAFEKGGRKARFSNLLDAGDTATDLNVPKGAVDALTNLWQLRYFDVASIKQPLQRKVMGLKRPIDQTVEVKGVAQQKIREKNRWRLEKLQQIRLTVTDEDKPDKNGIWDVFVRPTAATPLVPVMFTTQTKYGAFAAYLQE